MRKSAFIGVETAHTWPVYVPAELLPAFGDRGFYVRE